jgi:hypothetical protein
MKSPKVAKKISNDSSIGGPKSFKQKLLRVRGLRPTLLEKRDGGHDRPPLSGPIGMLV